MEKKKTNNFKALSFKVDWKKILVDYQNNNDKFSSVYLINTEDTEELKDISNLLSITTPDYIGGVIKKLKDVDLLIDRKELEARLWIAND